MRNKVLLPILLLATFALGACTPGGNDKKSSQEAGTSEQVAVEYGVAIANKAALQAEWFEGDSRDVDVTLTPAANPLAELGKNLTVTSSNPEVVAVTGLGLSALKAGTATITVSYHEKTDTVDVTISSNSPKIRYGTDHEGTEADPFTNEDAVKVAEAAGSTATSAKYYVKGVVDSFRDAPGNSYGNVSFYFTPAQSSGKKFLAYRLFKGEAGAHVTEDDIWIGGEATIYCNMYNYNGNTPENSAGWLVSCTGEKQTIQNHEVNVAEAIAACKALGANGTSDGKDTYDVTGYIVYINGADFYLSDTKGAATKNSETQFQVYNYTGENKDKCTLNAKVKVSCTLKYYKSSTSDSFAYETSVINAVEILEEGEEPAIEITGAPALETLAAGTYKLGLLQKTVNQNCFFKGTINSSKYAEVSQKWSEAADVVVEGDATAGFKMKVGDKYLNPIIDNNKIRVGLGTTAQVYQWNATAHTLTTSFEVGGKTDTYYLGTYGSNTTLGFSALSYLIKDGKIQDGQFASQFYAKAEANADPTALQLNAEATAIVGVPYNMPLRINPYNVDLSKVVWESSDQTVATVAAGVVSGLKAGNTVIKAKFGTTLVSECKVTVVEVELGSLESPLTVKQALEAAQTLQLAAGQFSPKKAYVKGVIEHTADTFHNDYYGKINLVNGEDKLYCANTKSAADKVAYENDEVIMSGYLSYDSTLKCYEMLKNADNVYPAVESITRGTSTITIKSGLENVTVSELSAQSGVNLSTFTFKVAAAAGYKVSKVSVSNGAQTEVLEGTDGVYTGTVKGNMVISAEAVDASIDVVEISVANLPAFFESSSTSTTEHEFTIGSENYGIYGAKTSSNADNATAGTKYDYIMLMGGAIYNKTTKAGFYLASVEVTYTSSTGTSGSIVVSIGATADTARATTGGTAPTKGGTVKVENTDQTKAYFNISNTKTNNTQIASIKLTFKAVTA